MSVYFLLKFIQRERVLTELRERVIAARRIQAERYSKLSISYNSEVSGEALNKFTKPDQGGLELLKHVL